MPFASPKVTYETKELEYTVKRIALLLIIVGSRPDEFQPRNCALSGDAFSSAEELLETSAQGDDRAHRTRVIWSSAAVIASLGLWSENRPKSAPRLRLHSARGSVHWWV